MGELLKYLEAYAEEGAYPFHMPGHKRNVEGAGSFFAEWFRRDVTEIPGMDDLHEPAGIIKAAEARAAALYGAERSFFLVNGSTAGVLAAISAAVRQGGTILLQRASHRSAYHAVQLRGLHVHYLYGGRTKIGETGSIGTGVTLAEVQDAVENSPGIDAVFLTSPSYDGFSADLAAIADWLHERNLPLIVDAAHGAHFGFSSSFPENAVRAGADAVIMSLHKTLPAPTQTALLHLGSRRIPEERLQRYLGIYQTSSPSYLLMAGIDECISRLSGWDDAVWQAFHDRREQLSRRLHRLDRIGVWDAFGRSRVRGTTDVTATGFPESGMPEPGKILLFPPEANCGRQWGERLAAEGIQCEMALPSYVLLISTVMDTEEGFRRLAEALERLDGESLPQIPEDQSAVLLCRVLCEEEAVSQEDVQTEWSIRDAAEQPEETVPLEDAVGRISAGFISVYPPGQPILVPGERITAGKAEEIRHLHKAGLSVQGIILQCMQ